MKTGTLVAYGWKYNSEEYISEPEKYGITLTEPVWCEESPTEMLIKEGEDWDIEIMEGANNVNVLWNSGIVEECSMENLLEVKKCQTGI